MDKNVSMGKSVDMLLESEKFQKIKNKKIMIYGTGKISKQLISQMTDYRIKIVSDRYVFSNVFEKIPFVDFYFVNREDIDAIIIASSIKNQKDIYFRIIDKALRNSWSIYNYCGVDLISYYGVDRRTVSASRYFRKNFDELITLIKRYDNISFDLFDTLVMRKVLHPTDILDITYQKLKSKGICIERFKELRIKAEEESQGKNIYNVYDILQKKCKWSDKLKNQILHEELNAEKENIIPRNIVVELMKYAKSIGKNVSIISDMYLPHDILVSILDDLGIKEYDKLYVSCDYNAIGKKDGLYNVYLNDCMLGAKCLHIGDNLCADIDAANKAGIDAYEIKSAADLLKMSNLHMLTGICKTQNDKNYVGLLISEIFNDPFALYQTSGVVQISSWRMFGQIIIAPLIICMINKILQEIDIQRNVDRVLFTARDCYMIKEVYDQIRKSKIHEKTLPESFYLYGSRRINLKVLSATNSADLLSRYVIKDDSERVLSDFLGIKNTEEVKKNKDEDNLSYFQRVENIVKAITRKTAENYDKYLKISGLDKNRKYIICDSVAQGTTQYCLQQMGYHVSGVYLAKHHGDHDYNIPVNPVYNTKNNCECSIYYKDAILEIIFTSMEATAVDIDEDCNIIFAKDTRTQDEKKIIRKIQLGAVEFAEKYFETLYYQNANTCIEIAEFCFQMMDDFEYIRECKTIVNMISVEDGFATKWINSI